jgi:hypothetical protein
MAWILLSARTKEINEALTSHLQSKSSELDAESYYNDNDLGLLDDNSVLEFLKAERGLEEAVLPRNGMQGDRQSAHVDLSEDDLYSVKTLRWLQQNGNTPEDKRLAKTQYRKIVFGLWRKRMAETGETWYPPLRDDLWERYKLMANDPDFI